MAAATLYTVAPMEYVRAAPLSLSSSSLHRKKEKEKKVLFRIFYSLKIK
jgi:hypothetical protein